MSKPVVLLIRDGWGHRKEYHKNGPLQGHTPYTDYLKEKYPWTLIEASESAVGLPKGFFGNSEVGHMTIGSGHIHKQPIVKITEAITDCSFFENEALLRATQNSKNLHILGLIQREGVHAQFEHLLAIIDLCEKEGLEDVAFHLFTDGRDAPVHKSLPKIEIVQKKLEETGVGFIATISGRYYAMDRDHRWDRTKLAYDAIYNAKGPSFDDAYSYVEKRHEKDETDEFITPAVSSRYTGAHKEDSVIFINFRGDRPRQLTKAFVRPEFSGFERVRHEGPFVTMTKYYDDIKADNIHVCFDRKEITETLGKWVSERGLKQLRIAESEKFPHVTYFFNGRRDEPYEGEERIHIPSPKVSTYDLQPEMSLYTVTDKLLEELDKEKHDFIVVNFANGDMVGHTGDWNAVLKAVEAVDINTERLVKKVQEKNGSIFITADHGNCDIEEGKYRTSHTLNPVEFIFIDAEEKPVKGLSDIAGILKAQLAK